MDSVARAKILPRLTEVSFAKGVLYNEGTEAGRAHAARFKHQKRLDLSENYLLPEHVKAIKKAIPCADVGDQREIEDDDEDSRYTAIGE